MRAPSGQIFAVTKSKNCVYCRVRHAGELRNGSLEICKGVVKFKRDITFRLETLHAVNTS